MKTSFAPKFHQQEYIRWLELNHPDIIEEWKLSGAAEDTKIYDYVQRKYWRVHSQWYLFMENGENE